jgi:hypothetical protein
MNCHHHNTDRPCSDLWCRSLVVLLAFSAFGRPTLDKCDLLFTECWKQCGRPAYFPFTCTVDPNSLFNATLDQVVTACQGPIECPACSALGTTCTKKTCAKCTDSTNPAFWKSTLTPGSLAWCECCALDCNGFRADCVAGPHAFCAKACASTLLCKPSQGPANNATAAPTPTANAGADAETNWFWFIVGGAIGAALLLVAVVAICVASCRR